MQSSKTVKINGRAIVVSVIVGLAVTIILLLAISALMQRGKLNEASTGAALHAKALINAGLAVIGNRNSTNGASALASAATNADFFVNLSSHDRYISFIRVFENHG